MLNKRTYTSLIAVLAFAFLQACTKNEDIPLEQRTEDVIYDKTDINGVYAEQALTNIYTFLPKGFNRVGNAFLDAATDDAVASDLVSNNINLLSKGTQSSTQTADEAYATNYGGIYRANLFLSKIDIVPVLTTTKQYWKAEARFLRAMFYFELAKRYGGVPLIGDKVLTPDDNAALPRNTYDQVVQYIVTECDAVSPLLQKEPVTQSGRATQGAALALKSRVLLYAASPLNNPGNDPAKWTAAAAAAKAVIDLNYYALNSSFVAAFVNRADKEVILGFQQAKNSNLERANAPIGYTTDLYASTGTTSPTQELVDAFPMNNGQAINAAGSGYNAATPYANRDPRFNATIFYNGAQWLGRAVQTYEGGSDKPNTAVTQTKTGYYLRKFLPDLSTASNYGLVDHNFSIFRYAEMLLNYAEAINESGDVLANRTIAYTQLTNIRKRAGITAGAGSLYGLKANMTQAEMRDAIRLERRIEMAFEEQRFWDVRRWKTAATDFNKILHGMKITMTAPGIFTYQVVSVEPIVFIAPRMYLYPFAFPELQANPALTQNPGW
ncbi:RagB/SusD family nutrient uptake outer membrane protein [Hufsiella ginkgonis]|uniref:RagB/SusD family nutrient uptake outer membrane protein n=1 Tax=Hufsiella ginkgonis TaxID=2695274 RepID=A0A7K1XS34_9SPHI|nr:RagB/SusD family nutrient uptake outer membrane protein [Hufsiella ginkgonis]MXV13778.1 RagB/SusD family nutrient uptake outer membrane protein [Hufsiella ginkgonis]